MVFTVPYRNAEILGHLLFYPCLCLPPVLIFINPRDYNALTFGNLFSKLCVKWMFFVFGADV